MWMAGLLAVALSDERAASSSCLERCSSSRLLGSMADSLLMKPRPRRTRLRRRTRLHLLARQQATQPSRPLLHTEGVHTVS